MTSQSLKVETIDMDNYQDPDLEELADLECDAVSIEITEPCTLIVCTSEWAQVYKLIKKGAENDLPSA